MKEKEKKYVLDIITAEIFDHCQDRYEIRKGNLPNAPLCPFGNTFKWIGFDKKEMKYVRFTKSVFKRLIKELDPKVVRKHEMDFGDTEESE